MSKLLISVLVLLPLASCASSTVGSPVRIIAPPLRLDGDQGIKIAGDLGVKIAAGDMPEPASFCPMPTVGNVACVDPKIVASQRECAVRYQAEAWRRSKANAETQGFAPADAPLATAIVTRDWHDGTKIQPDAEWNPVRGKDPSTDLLFPLTEAGKAKFGDTMVVPVSETDALLYLARRDDTYVLVVPDYRQRETRELTVCGPRCPEYGSPTPAPERVLMKAAVLPPGKTFAGMVRLPVDILMISEKVLPAERSPDCPGPPP